MTDFQFRTRGQSSPQGKPRVYFTCHPEDFDRYFETVVKELLDRQNCAVFYVDMNAEPEDVDDYELRLGEMQLFVVPVTTKLLTSPNRAMDFDVPFAFGRHIPVLPLVQESGLEDLFNRRFGDLQYLDKVNTDPTAIPYDEKLTNYLNSVIVGDELAAQVRAAFDAYIFLSYRKKDRKYAQELMRLIHANPFCRDIAIWYDEFLTPGENFNEAIKAALEKSKLFALTVTPNLLEMPGGKPNFVMDKEYPAAKDAKKPILPVEMVQTGHFKLKMKYKGIPEPIARDDRETLRTRLTEQIQRLAVASNNNDPKHNFFIGLAYLTGIDVEVDHAKALELITGSAEADFVPAIKKLVSMYNTGEGVKRDYHTAVEWQEKLVALREKAYSDSPSEDTGKYLLSDIWKLGDAYYALRLLDRAEDAYTKLLKYSDEMYKSFQNRYYFRMKSVGFSKLGNISKAQGRLNDSKEYYEKSLEIRKAIAEETDTVESKRDLSVSCIKLGNIAAAQGRQNEAKEYYEKALQIRKAIAEETDTIHSKLDLSISYNKLGDIAKAQGRLSEAKEHYEKSLEIRKTIAEETDTVESKRDLSISYNKLGDIAKALGRLNEAKEYYERAFKIRKAIAEESGTIESKRDLSISYNKLGNIAAAQSRQNEAKEYYEKSMEIRKTIAEETDTIESRRDLSVSYNKLGNIAKAQGRLEEAEEYHEKALEIRKVLAEETRTIESRRDLSVSYEKLGDIARAQGRLSEAKEYYEKALEIRKAIAEETDTVQSKRDLSVSYEKLGNIAKAQGSLDKAREYYEKALEIDKALAEETSTVQSYDDLAVSYYKLGALLRDKVYLQKALDIWKKLSERCPDVAMYKKYAGIAERELRKIG